MRLICAMLLTLTVLTGCVTTQTETPVLDRAKPLAVTCAGALAGSSIEDARTDCIPLLSTLEAGAGWR